jgi:4-hydroxyphenylpyruvate dioxygenase
MGPFPHDDAAATIGDAEFDRVDAADPRPRGAGFSYIDHLTYNVRRGGLQA